MKTNSDILSQLFVKADNIFPISNTRFTIGEKYVAALGMNGQIGVCATLGKKNWQAGDKGIDLSQQEHRVLVNAYVNSVLNYKAAIDGSGDIFEVVEFRRYNHIVMIGYFGSLVQKLLNIGIKPFTFDLDQHEAPVLPMELQQEHLYLADCVILTSTSLSNATFEGIISSIPKSCSVFMLGPSTPLDDLMFTIPQVKGLFGSIFPLHHHETLNLIAQGNGTRGFMHNMAKVYRLNP